MSAFSSRKVLVAVAAVAATALTFSVALPAQAASEDKTLRIAGIIPLTGGLAFLSPPEVAALHLAVDEINAAGGVLGNKVELTIADSGDGDTLQIADQSATKAIAKKADVVIGAASSGVTRSIINKITGAKIVEISMSNTAPDLTTWNDGGFYFRTAPSDLLQGAIVGNQIVADGNENVGIIYQQTSYGEGLEAKAKAVIEAAGAKVVSSLPFPENETNFDTIVDQTLAAGADSVLVISYDEIKKIVPALQKKKFDGSKIYLVDGNLANFSDQPWKSYLKGAQGTLPGGKTDEAFKKRAADLYKANHGEELTEFAYLAESYDAIILLALAAEEAGDDSGASIQAHMTSVSTGGTKVTNFADGLKVIKDGGDVDYEGFSGPIEFDENGDPTGASIGIWQYADTSGVSVLKNVVAGNSVK